MAEDEIRSGLHHRDGDRAAVVREHGGHADLLADDARRHCVLLAFPTANVRAACGAEAAAAGRKAAPCVGGCRPAGSPALRGPRRLTAGACRRRSRALRLVFVCGASAAGAALGLLKQPDPGDQAANFAFTTAAALETARRADERARRSEAELAAARSRIEALSAGEQELSDFREA